MVGWNRACDGRRGLLRAGLAFRKKSVRSLTGEERPENIPRQSQRPRSSHPAASTDSPMLPFHASHSRGCFAYHLSLSLHHSPPLSPRNKPISSLRQVWKRSRLSGHGIGPWGILYVELLPYCPGSLISNPGQNVERRVVDGMTFTHGPTNTVATSREMVQCSWRQATKIWAGH